jgi:hypothetical protein
MVIETAHSSSYSSAYEMEEDSSLGALDGTRAGQSEVIWKGFQAAPSQDLPVCQLFFIVVGTLDLMQNPWEGGWGMGFICGGSAPCAC